MQLFYSLGEASFAETYSSNRRGV